MADLSPRRLSASHQSTSSALQTPQPAKATALNSGASATKSNTGESCGCDPPGDADGIQVSNKNLNADELRAAADLPIIDTHGKSHTFKSVVQQPGVKQHMVILIRHWFCSNCQMYIERIGEEMPPSSLPPSTALTIVGCGAPDLMSKYLQETKCPYPLFTDHSAKVYKALGMGRTLDLGDKKGDYMQESFASGVFRGIWSTLAAGRRLFQGGDWKQVGGEVLFEVGDDAGGDGWRCDSIHRMKTTRDHLEIPELKRRLGVGGA